GLSLGAHQVLVGIAASDPAVKTVPDCQDSAGNHLNYTQSTDAFSCGTSSSGGGGGIGGSGTTNTLPLFTGSTTLGNSNITQNADGTNLAGKSLTWASTYKPTFNSGATTTCDLSQSNVCEVDFGAGNTTLALTNPHGSGLYVLRSCM